LVRGLFGGDFKNRRLDLDNLAQILAEADASGSWSPEVQGALEHMSAMVARREQAFASAMLQLTEGIASAVSEGHADSIRQARVDFLDAANSPEGLTLASEVIAAQSAYLAGLSVPERLVKLKSPMLLDGFGTTVRFMLRLVRKSLESQVN